jgi:hypothetical protein
VSDQPYQATYGMSPVERILLTVTGVILFAITGWTLDRVILNTGKIAVLEQRVQYQEITQQRLYEELKDHRHRTENN